MGELLMLKKISFKRDKSVVERVINGDKESFNLLIESYEEYLYKMAFIYMKNEQDALDVYQETILKSIMGIHNLKNPNYFKTWITRILINNVNSRYKDKKRFEDNEDLENLKEILYEEIDEKIDLYQAIDILDEKYKTPIVLQYFHDMTIKDISKILECNENTVKSNLKRGKNKLFEVLSGGKRYE